MREERKVYFLLSYTGSWLSRLIKFATKMEYTHVAIAVDREFNNLYSFGRKRPTNPFIGGFVKEDLKGGVYSYFPNTICSICSLDVTDEEYEKIIFTLNEFKRNKDKYAYDFIGLIGVYFNRELVRENHYFCSQFVSTILMESGIDLFEKEPKFVTPEDFSKCRELKCLYTGGFDSKRIDGILESLAQPI